MEGQFLGLTRVKIAFMSSERVLFWRERLGHVFERGLNGESVP